VIFIKFAQSIFNHVEVDYFTKSEAHQPKKLQPIKKYAENELAVIASTNTLVYNCAVVVKI
jgi:hypothetical protein